MSSSLIASIDAIETHINGLATKHPTGNGEDTTSPAEDHENPSDLRRHAAAQKLNTRVGVISRKMLARVDEVATVGRFVPNPDAKKSSCMPGTHETLWPAASDEAFHKLVEHIPALRKIEGDGTKVLEIKNSTLITRESQRALYEWLWRHPEVEEIDLSYVRGFDVWFGIRIGHAIFNSAHIKVLRFEECDAGVNALAGICVAVHQLKTLTILDLAHTAVLETGATFLAATLRDNGVPNLVELNLTKCNIGVTGGVALSVALATHDHLRILRVGNNGLRTTGTNALILSLASKNLLEELDIQKNQMRSQGTLPLQNWIAHPHCSLKKIKLGENLIGHGGARGLAVALARNTSIKEFGFARNYCGNEGSGFGMCLSQNATLESLDLSKNDMGDDACVALVTGLQLNATLKHLRLAGEVVLSDRGAVALAKYLTSGKCKLETLDLSGNDIRDEGAIALGGALDTNTTLRYLLLQNNDIQDAGGKALGEGLRKSNQIQALDISNNPINQELVNEYFSEKRRRTIVDRRRRSSVHSGPGGGGGGGADPEYAGLVLIHDGTESAMQNLKDYGIVFGEYRVGWADGLEYTILAVILAVLGVASNSYTVVVNVILGDYVYAVLVGAFLILPLIYFAVFLSHPRAFIPSAHGHVNKSRYDSFIQQMQMGVDSKEWGMRRVGLALISVIGLRIPYEFFLSWRQGSTTLDLESCELAWAVLHSTPTALVQMHQLWTSLPLKKLITAQSLSSIVSIKSSEDLLYFFQEYSIVISVAVSVLSLGSTFSTLFEQKDVFNWAVSSPLHDDTAKTIGSTISLLSHLSHWIARLITLSLTPALYAPVLCTALIVLSLVLRVGIWGMTGSKRHINFCFVTCIVGANAWDTRMAVRLTILLEFCEAAVISGVLWVPAAQILAVTAVYPNTLLNNKIIEIQNTIGASTITIALFSTLGFSALIHFTFLERIRIKSYEDVALRRARHMRGGKRRGNFLDRVTECLC